MCIPAAREGPCMHQISRQAMLSPGRDRTGRQGTVPDATWQGCARQPQYVHNPCKGGGCFTQGEVVVWGVIRVNRPPVA